MILICYSCLVIQSNGDAGGVALTSPVTVNGVALATVATSANYTDLVARPKFYFGSSSIPTLSTGTPTQPNNIAYWYGTTSVTGSAGVAVIYPTANGLSNGTALFSSILSVSAVGYVSSASSANSGVVVVVTSVATTLKSVSLMASTGSGGLVGLVYAGSGTVLMCTVVGTYAS